MNTDEKISMLADYIQFLLQENYKFSESVRKLESDFRNQHIEDQQERVKDASQQLEKSRREHEAYIKILKEQAIGKECGYSHREYIFPVSSEGMK